MKKILPTILASTIGAILFSPHSYADLRSQCLSGVPHYTKPLIEGDPNTQTVTILSDDANVDYPNRAFYQGNVNVEQGNRQLTSHEAEVTQQLKNGQPIKREMTARGNVHYFDPTISLKGPRAWSDLDSKDTDVDQANYQFVDKQGRGTAKELQLRENRYNIMKSAVFTTCLPEDDSWSIAATTMVQDRQEEMAELWNARFQVAGVPIFYTPYLQIPLGNKRRSGFLVPAFKTSNKDGIQLDIPYYWNIAPNYDATITPRYMSKRGTEWMTEFRYLTTPGAGTIAFDYLANDPLHQDESRYLTYWGHSGVINQVWRFNVNYTKVSDPKYFNDLDSPYGSTTDGYVTQTGNIGYADPNWMVNLSATQFQVFDRQVASVYRTSPQLDINYYNTSLLDEKLNTHLFGQIVRFENNNPAMPTATRVHLEPSFSYPLANRWGSIEASGKLYATHYQQDIPVRYQTQMDDSVSRFIPQGKIDAKMILERDTALLNGYTQTLEPQVQYLYRPYRDQSSIGAPNSLGYDSTALQLDYLGMFRDRRYSGLDRISSANQITTGLTTRIFDQGLNERFNFAIGQIFYLSAPRITEKAQHEARTSAWATESNVLFNENWSAKAGVQYDPQDKQVTLANTAVEYRKDSERLVQLNYRYASQEYINSALPNKNYDHNISQVGLVSAWPVTDKLGVVGQYYYDTGLKQSAEQLLGLQYNTCCWAVNLMYERKTIGYDNNTRTSTYDNAVSFNVEIRGLGNNYSTGIGKMLGSGILPYQRPFTLNN
ncbi:MAG: LPS assembly protein LptD [Plesiomonas sp.]|uniref:LPS assembly protein LptD n=2 Tax=Plesiomonas sp. TaxID=2486279 RepID=UPI003F3BB8DF